MIWNSILVQFATMRGVPQDENRLHQGWWSVEPFGLSPQSLLVCIPFLGQNFARLISHNGVRGAGELDRRHEARRVQHRFRKSQERYLAALEEKLIKERLLL